MFVHIDGQLRAAHLILDYIPISKSFQALKSVIKARDPRLHRINVATPSFPITGPVPEGMLTTDLIPESILKVALPPPHTIEEATSSNPTITKEEEEEEKEEEVVEISDFEDEFEFFNQTLPSKTSTGDLRQPSPSQSSHHRRSTSTLDDMGIQRKPRFTLQELLESQLRKDVPKKAAQTKLPTPPPTQTFQADPTNHKRKRYEKGKKVVEIGRTLPSHKVKPQRRAKQPRGLQTRSANEAEQKGDHRARTLAWAPRMELDGAPLLNDTSI